MNRSEFQARVKYSWKLRTADFARVFRRRMSSDKLLELFGPETDARRSAESGEGKGCAGCLS